MNKDQILKLSGMPAACPSYPKGPYRFYGREYFIITYETNAEAIRNALPEPLEPVGNTVSYEFMNMKDSSGFGSYSESGLVIPCKLNGEDVNFTVMMFLNDEPPITGGREIWGFPKKYGEPKLEVVKETLVGTLRYSDELVAMGTMGYKDENMLHKTAEHKVLADVNAIKQRLGKTQINLKVIPCASGEGMVVAQLVAYNMTDIDVKGAWSGHARLHLVPHVNATVADFPVNKVIGGSHFVADITLPYGRIVHDYLKK